MSAIGKGDLVVKVGGPCTLIPRGRVLRVAAICQEDHGDDDLKGLLFAEYPECGDPDTCDCFHPENFRKLNDGTDDAELIARIKRCQPIKDRQHA